MLLEKRRVPLKIKMKTIFKTKTQKDAVIETAISLGCTPQEAALLSRKCSIVEHQDGAMLAKLRGIGEQIHVILEGGATVVLADGTTSVLGAGDVVGELYAYRFFLCQMADVTCNGPVKTFSIGVETYNKIREEVPTLRRLVEDAKNDRINIVEKRRHEDAVRRWEQYQSIKPYLGL